MKITTKFLKKVGACRDAIIVFEKRGIKLDGVEWVKLLMKEDNFDWANWLLTRLMTGKQSLKYAIYAANSVIGIFEKEYPKDKRPREALQAAELVSKHDNAKNRKAAAAAADAAADADAYAAAAAAAADAAAYAAAAAAAADAAAYAAAADAAAYAAADAADADADVAAYAAAYAADAAALTKDKIINYGIKLIKRGK